ncbi:hypothetical protein [Halobacterium yunchengense]|uniref:hypothetical protein n=1 Tax=Halobacterium yunchengense TaxID=3108497 RepID=UPI00300888FC
MGQLIESRFRILDFDEDDAQMTDIADVGQPVYVAKELDEYSQSLQSKIDDLEVGYVVEAEIQSESVTRQDSFWKFVDLKIVDRTRFHFIEDASTHPAVADKLFEGAKKSDGNSARTALASNGEPIGYITVAETQGGSFWSGLRMGVNSHEFDLQNLEELDSPPFEAIYTRDSEEGRLVFYHFCEKGTEIAKTIISANSPTDSNR